MDDRGVAAIPAIRLDRELREPDGPESERPQHCFGAMGGHAVGRQTGRKYTLLPGDWRTAHPEHVVVAANEQSRSTRRCR